MSGNQLPPGYAIGERGPRTDPAVVAELGAVPVPVIGDCMGRIVGTSRLRPYHPATEPRLAGPALTVRVRPGDNLMLHKAMLLAEPGDVIVVDGAGDTNQALIGGLMRATAISRRIGGFVIDGAVRDVAEWAEGGMPVFAAGNSLRGPSKDGPGEINVPIACAGLVVHPGDIVVADADGVICVTPHEIGSLLERCRVKLADEDRVRQQNASGATDAERIDNYLRSRGVPLE
jgi:regulator of RNase E activity RraA